MSMYILLNACHQVCSSFYLKLCCNLEVLLLAVPLLLLLLLRSIAMIITLLMVSVGHATANVASTVAHVLLCLTVALYSCSMFF